jgi:DNA repair protein RadC
MREFVLRYLPDIGPASQAKVLQSLSNSFTQLGVARGNGTELRFQIHSGTLAGFLYVLTALFPRMGMYSFGELENGPMRRWLLWDREWMRRQLYNLRDLGILSKVSEIDTIRQFTVGLDQAAALQRFFAQPPEALSALRETPAPARD